MTHPQTKPDKARTEHIDVTHDYAVCAWARHFNVSQARVRAAVAQVGPQAQRVGEHLHEAGERPSGH